MRILEHGQRKSEKSERVILVPGDQDQVSIVRDIFKAKADGRSVKSICRNLNSRQVLPRSAYIPNFRRTDTHRWTLNTVYNILTNPIYRGDWIYNRQIRGNWIRYEYPELNWRTPNEHIICEEAHEGIINIELFDKAQESLNRRVSGRPKQFRGESPYLLSGLITCFDCGGRFHGHIHRNNQSTPHRYYENSCYDLGIHTPSIRTMIPKDDIESFVTEQIVSRVLSLVNMDWLKKRIQIMMSNIPENHGAELARINQALRENAHKMENVLNSIEKGIDLELARPRVAKLKMEMRGLEKTRNQIQKQQGVSKSADEIIECIAGRIRDLKQILAGSQPYIIKKGIHAMVKDIVVNSRNRTATCRFYRLPRVDALDHICVGYNNAGGRT